MIINFLFKGKANLMNRDKYYLYLDYLRSIGYSYNLLDKFYKIYEYVDNELTPVLESIEGVASVSATGSVEERYEVTIREDKVEALNVKMQEE